MWRIASEKAIDVVRIASNAQIVASDSMNTVLVNSVVPIGNNIFEHLAESFLCHTSLDSLLQGDCASCFAARRRRITRAHVERIIDE